MAFDSNRKETIIAETDYRVYCAIACIDGEYVRFVT